MNDITNYLDSKKVAYKVVGKEAILVCPDCLKEKLSINIDTGVYKCWHCEAINENSIYARGHIGKLKEVWGDIISISSVSDRMIGKNGKEIDFTELVDRYHYKILENKKVIKYLLKRGITEESIEKFKLGFTRRYNQDWLVIPSFEDGIPKLIKYRKLPPDENEELDKYIREKDSKSILFNGDALKDNDEIICVEGEIDSLTLIQHGYDNIVGLTGGAATLRPEWYDVLATKSKIYLILDSDPVGQKAAKDVWATRLGISRCYNVLLPDGEDVNSYLLKNSVEDMENLIQNAKPFRVDGILSFKETLTEMYRRATDKREKFELPWKSLNKIMGGFEKQRLIVIGGQASMGKTIMSTQILYNFAKMYDMPSLMFCMEMPEVALAAKIIQLEKDLTSSEIDYSDALVYAMEMQDLPIYFGYSPSITPEIFYNTVKEVRNRYGIEACVFDNLQLLVRTGEEKDMGRASALFKQISMELNIIMILVSQPRKLNTDRQPTFDDLKGSSAISQDADEIILLHRVRIPGSIESFKAFESECQVIVEKDRYGSGGKTILEIIGNKSKFIEIPKIRS